VRIVIGCLVATLVAVPSAQQQPQPVFRARVDLVTVDVAVVNNEGRPVTGLAPGDFTVVAGDRQRRVVSADFVSVGAAARTAPVPLASRPAAPTSNSRAAAGRSFLLVVDVEHISAGGGRGVLRTVSDYLDRLNPEDRAGVVVFPYATPRVDLTTNRKMVKEAAGRIVGSSLRNQSGTMTVGEAAAVEQMDQHALDDYLQRVNLVTGSCTVTSDVIEPEVAARIDPTATSCLMKMQPAASFIMDNERRRSRDLLDTLGALSAAMSSIEGPKAIVLISEGMVVDRNLLADLQKFSDAAERSRVMFYALNLAGALSDVGSRYNMTTAHVLDQKVLFDGMSLTAVAGRGEAFMVSGTPLGALARIDAEMSGYYLLSFERDGEDRDGNRQKIDVRVNWPGATLRARKDFTINPPAPELKPPADLKGAIGQVLRWPVSTTDLGVDLDTYLAPGLEGRDELKTIIAASLASAGRPLAAIGYEVVDTAGKVIADGFEAEGLATERLSGDRQLYLSAVKIPDGEYRLKFAAISADGRRGSVEHEFVVAAPRAGGVRMSDVFLGEVSGKGFLPTPWVLPGTAALPITVEILGDSPEALTGAVVTLELARPANAPLARLPLSQKEVNDPRRRLASATLAIGALPAGEYTITAVLRTADGSSLQRTRLFTKR